jgi:hypothetical protein
MKKFLILAGVMTTVILFSNCHSAKKASAEIVAPKTTYQNSIQTLVVNNCSPCHIPSKGGNKKPLDTYDAAKTNIDDMIHRIELNPTDKGFMPFKHAKLSDSTIAVFKQWRDNGMLN